jgi:hypothetical protein
LSVLITVFQVFDSNFFLVVRQIESKKCVAYPQEDFLFTILYGHQKSIYPKSEKNKVTYGIYPTKFAISTQKHKKVVETPNQQIEIKKKQITICLVLQKWKEGKNSYGATRRSLQAQPKILINLSEHQIYQSGLKFFQKKNA